MTPTPLDPVAVRSAAERLTVHNGCGQSCVYRLERQQADLALAAARPPADGTHRADQLSSIAEILATEGLSDGEIVEAVKVVMRG